MLLKKPKKNPTTFLYFKHQLDWKAFTTVGGALLQVMEALRTGSCEEGTHAPLSVIQSQSESVGHRREQSL